MGSNYYGDANNQRINESSSSPSSSSSSRKGKKGNSDKPKQPQRGLGVAQLEKIRLNSQLASNYLPSVHNTYPRPLRQEDINLQAAYSSSSSFPYSSSSAPPYGYQGPHYGVMMGVPDLDRTTIRYGDIQSSNITKWHPGNAGMGTQHVMEPVMARPFFEPIVESSIKTKNTKERNDMGSSSQNLESSNSEEIDLELRL